MLAIQILIMAIMIIRNAAKNKKDMEELNKLGSNINNDMKLNKLLIDSIKEISDNNTQLSRKIDNLDERLTKIEKGE